MHHDLSFSNTGCELSLLAMLAWWRNQQSMIMNTSEIPTLTPNSIFDLSQRFPNHGVVRDLCILTPHHCVLKGHYLRTTQKLSLTSVLLMKLLVHKKRIRWWTAEITSFQIYKLLIIIIMLNLRITIILSPILKSSYIIVWHYERLL